MNINDEYDADEILREREDFEEPETTEDVDELDFENDRKKSFDEIVGDLEEPADLLD